MPSAQQWQTFRAWEMEEKRERLRRLTVPEAFEQYCCLFELALSAGALSSPNIHAAKIKHLTDLRSKFRQLAAEEKHEPAR